VSDRPTPRRGRGGADPVVEIYPAAPGATRSRSHRVRALGQAVFVERFGDVSYARFAMDGPVTVAIEVARSIAVHRIFPEEGAHTSSVARNILTVVLAEPRSIVVWIDDLEKLFLLPDPIAHEPPVAGAPGVVDPAAHGADPTGRALSTTALQAAIDEAAGRPGGGTVLVPHGRFRTGTLTLPSGLTLYLAPGALLHGSSDASDYPLDPGRTESAADLRLAPDERFLGRTMTFSRLLLVDGAEGVTIKGRGTIDGDGTALRTRSGIAPNLLRVRESRDVLVRDVLFRDAAAWSLHVLASRRVGIANVKVINDRGNLNTDGIDPDMSSDVTIERCFVYTKDDGICIKATGNGDLADEPRRIVARGNLVSSLDAALKVGTESAAAVFADILFDDNHVFESGPAMSIVVRDGATYKRIAFRGIRVGPGVDHLVEQVIGVRDPAAALGAIHDLAFEDVAAPDSRPPASNWTWFAQFRPDRPAEGDDVDMFAGADATHALDGLEFRSFIVNGERLVDAETARRVANLTIGANVRNVTFD
jgi:hypothetical protein